MQSIINRAQVSISLFQLGISNSTATISIILQGNNWAHHDTEYVQLLFFSVQETILLNETTESCDNSSWNDT